MSIPLFLEVVPQTDANPVSFTGKEVVSFGAWHADLKI